MEKFSEYLKEESPKNELSNISNKIENIRQSLNTPTTDGAILLGIFRDITVKMKMGKSIKKYTKELIDEFENYKKG